MTLWEILVVAVALAMDAFAVTLAAATSGCSAGGRAAFRLSFHFGLFQALMPLAGWALGHGFVDRIESVDHWVALGLLSFVGLRMIRSALGDDEAPSRDPSRGSMLVVLSLATSIDALAVGLSLAMLRVPIWFPCLIIGVVTAVLSLVAFRLGRRLGRRFGKRMELAGGVLLILIGVKIVLSHTLA